VEKTSAVERAILMSRKTALSIQEDGFLINGRPTYAGRVYGEMKIEGLLLNARMVQGIFDDLNPQTRRRWAYPDTGVWDPERNTREFVEAMPLWREHGLLAFTLNLQGGSPEGYSKEQPWHNSAWTPEGELRPEYASRLRRVLDKADDLGMAVILGLFYFGQEERLKDEAAVKRAVSNAAEWVLKEGYTNLLIEINNECDVPSYQHEILRPQRVPELIEQVKEIGQGRLLAGTSYAGGSIPGEKVAAVSDFLLLHGNGVEEPERIGEMVRQARALSSYRPRPILFNEDDHFDFDRPKNNLLAAVGEYASWGYFDPGESNYGSTALTMNWEGYQCPPVNWGINTARKKAFFGLVSRVSGALREGISLDSRGVVC